MIELTPLARPYAKALFESAIESNSIDEMAVELKTMAAAAKTEGIINTIENPTLSRKEIVEILVNLFEESVSDTAKFGGSLGWIQKNQISKNIYNELSKINVGEFTSPINIPGGVIIIKINEKKISELEIDYNLELKKMIQFEKNRQLRQFSSIYYKKIKNNSEIYEN